MGRENCCFNIFSRNKNSRNEDYIRLFNDEKFERVIKTESQDGLGKEAYQIKTKNGSVDLPSLYDQNKKNRFDILEEASFKLGVNFNEIYVKTEEKGTYRLKCKLDKGIPRWKISNQDNPNDKSTIFAGDYALPKFTVGEGLKIQIAAKARLSVLNISKVEEIVVINNKGLMQEKGLKKIPDPFDIYYNRLNKDISESRVENQNFEPKVINNTSTYLYDHGIMIDEKYKHRIYEANKEGSVLDLNQLGGDSIKHQLFVENEHKDKFNVYYTPDDNKWKIVRPDDIRAAYTIFEINGKLPIFTVGAELEIQCESGTGRLICASLGKINRVAFFGKSSEGLRRKEVATDIADPFKLVLSLSDRSK